MGHLIANNVIESGADQDEVQVGGTICQDPKTGDWAIIGNLIRCKGPGPAIELTDDKRLFICGTEVSGTWTGFPWDNDDDQDSLISEYEDIERGK